MTYNAELQEEYTERDKPGLLSKKIVGKHRKPVKKTVIECTVCNGIEHKVSKARGIRTSHSKILAGAKPTEWLAKPTKWLASRNAGRGRVMPPKSTPTPETSQSARVQATFASQKGNSPTSSMCINNAIVHPRSKVDDAIAGMSFNKISKSSALPDVKLSAYVTSAPSNYSASNPCRIEHRAFPQLSSNSEDESRNMDEVLAGLK
ncbi:hypothetical protein DFH09DRAFT_1098797 [Mycena vulgaris]|nr:hypothetical protein DFH09DRAFT_1098797 [Mycena vulgaris]